MSSFDVWGYSPDKNLLLLNSNTGLLESRTFSELFSMGGSVTTVESGVELSNVSGYQIYTCDSSNQIVFTVLHGLYRFTQTAAVDFIKYTTASGKQFKISSNGPLITRGSDNKLVPVHSSVLSEYTDYLPQSNLQVQRREVSRKVGQELTKIVFDDLALIPYISTNTWGRVSIPRKVLHRFTEICTDKTDSGTLDFVANESIIWDLYQESTSVQNTNTFLYNIKSDYNNFCDYSGSILATYVNPSPQPPVITVEEIF